MSVASTLYLWVAAKSSVGVNRGWLGPRRPWRKVLPHLSQRKWAVWRSRGLTSRGWILPPQAQDCLIPYSGKRFGLTDLLGNVLKHFWQLPGDGKISLAGKPAAFLPIKDDDESALGFRVFTHESAEIVIFAGTRCHF